MLNDLKKYGTLHAQAQHIPRKEYWAVLNRINRDEGNQEGSWVCEFSRQGHIHSLLKNPLLACQYYNLARFPIIDSEDKKLAHQQCINHFMDYCKQTQTKIEKNSFTINNKMGFYYLIKNKITTAPILIVMGGIVSIKEQWHSLILFAKKLNFHLVLTEMPGVGENEVRYDIHSHRLFSVIIDSLSSLLLAKEVHVLAMSFSGHLALQGAFQDQRIQSIFTIGSPISDFFTDLDHWQTVPNITKQTLRHILQCSANDILNQLKNFPIKIHLLQNIHIPICYINSRLDDIIPQSESAFLAHHLSNLDIIEFNDEHGSPQHLNQIKLALTHFLLNHASIRSIPLTLMVKVLSYFFILPHRKPRQAKNRGNYGFHTQKF